MMRNVKKIILFSICTVLIYTGWAYMEAPNNYIQFANENISQPLNLYDISEVKKISAASATGKQDLQLKLFGLIPLKNISFQVLRDVEVVPGGNAIGIKLYTKGLLVVNVARFEAENNIIVSPALDSGIKDGDIILKINDSSVQSNEDFVKKIKENGSNYAKITIYRNNTQFDVEVEPQKAKDSGDYKIGTWVRDSATGIGTLTFYRKDNNKFAALGHSIIDNDIGEKYNVENGCIEQARVSSVVKGEKGYPGELKGILSSDETVMGNVEGNSINGIYGTIENSKDNNTIKVASRWNIKEGPATILCTIQNDTVESFNIDIQKIMYNSGNSSKSMIIKITDERLLDITGGIVQGMSGSPIIQNEKLVGAVTHVFVNDPTRGYAIFAENMLEMTN